MTRSVTVVGTLVAGVSPESGDDLAKVIDFLRAYRDAKQYVIDKIWDRRADLPSLEKLHHEFYEELRKLGFRAHHVKEILKSARELVKAMHEKEKKGEDVSKPELRRLTARLDIYDIKIDFERRTVRLPLLNGESVTLKLRVYEGRVRKFEGWKFYNCVLRFCCGKLFLHIMFRKVVKLGKPKTVLAVDPNFRNFTVAIMNRKGRILRIKRYENPLPRALTLRIWAERIQKRYPKSWRFSKNILAVVRKFHRRSRNVLRTNLHKVAKMIVELADKHNSIIVLEKLDGLKRKEENGSYSFRKSMTFFAYRTFQEFVEYKAKERGIPVTRVSPRGTSSRCPRCGKRRRKYEGRILKCRCGFAGDRDVVACINLVRKYLSRCARVRGHGRTGTNPSSEGHVSQADESMRVKVNNS